MEVHRQRCQACDSIEHRNILVRDDANQTSVYVRCAQCSGLVAKYELQGYYHHGKGIESYLRGQHLPESESGRATLERFQQVKSDAVAGYESALEQLNRDHKDV